MINTIKKSKILYVSKQDGKIPTSEMVRIFQEEKDLDKINKAVKNAEERLYVSWASVEMKDKAGELIPIDAIINDQETLMKRHGPISDEHTNRIVGETQAYKVMEHPETNSRGVLHLNKIHNDNIQDDKVWSEIKSGERKGSSVGGFNTENKIGTDEVTGDRVKVLDGFRQYETASVFEPCNPMALNEGISAIAKSIETKKGNLVKIIKELPDEIFDNLEDGIKELIGKQDYGPHQHNENNPNGEHNHEELQEQIDEIKEPKESDKNVNVIKNKILKQNINEVNSMTDTKKQISELEKSKNDIEKKLANLRKAEDEEPKEEDDKLVADEDKKKTEDEDNDDIPVLEEDTEENEDEVDKSKVKKEEARSDIEGEEPAKDQPEAPTPEVSNESDAFKTMQTDLAKANKSIAKMEKRMASTPMMGADITKGDKDDFQKSALDIATGKKGAIGFAEVTKTYNKYYNINK